MKCDICFCTETYENDYEHTYFIKGKKIKFTSKRRFCRQCNNLVYDPVLDNEAGRKAIDLYNKKYGIPKEKIIELRKKYNLSQDLFSKIIGCAKKTLISYEKGTTIPNENYIILINSLILKPDTILTLIESNKYQFNKKEYKKIQDKITMFLGNNSKQLFYDEEFIPNEYNGYTKLNKEKVLNMILLFANDCVLKTKLLKEMFYADFVYYKNTGTSITGLEYSKINLGPVPDNYETIINEWIKEGFIKDEVDFKNDYEYHNIKSLTKVNEKVFEEKEIEAINKVKEYFKDFKSNQIANYSHEEKAFKETEFYNKISYDYAFYLNCDINI